MKDAPTAYGPGKTLYNRFVRLEPGRDLQQIFCELSRQHGQTVPYDRRDTSEGPQNCS